MFRIRHTEGARTVRLLFTLATLAGVMGFTSAALAQPRFGTPFPGLTADQMRAFNAGKDEFTEVATPQSGLGPIFNRDSCAACHSVPSLGGSSNILVTRFGHSTPQS